MIFAPGFRLPRWKAATIAATVALAAAWPARPAEPPPARPGAAALAAARLFLCPHGGSPVGGGRCRPGASGDAAVRGWDRGLPPAAHLQAECPAGTRAEPALAGAPGLRCRPLP